LQQLVRKYKLPEIQLSSSASSAEPISKPFKTYTSSTGHSILVGKSALDNDDLTKSARSNDYWLHAVGVTGSHVIVPITPDIRQALPTHLLREAAILALHFSRMREDLSGECYVTRKQFLKKQRGMPAGLWRINQSESLFFRYTEEELQNLLQTVRV
jgi:predicted ribosome quality control (RQC) complex YloA/Tae2 family protein